MGKLDFKPAQQRVLVLPLTRSGEKTPSGIILPESHQEDKPQLGKIVRVGKGDSDYPMNYKIGEKVIFSKYAGVELSMNLIGVGHEEFKVMQQGDIMGTVEEVSE